MAYHFFSDINSIITQTTDDSFGPLSNETQGGQEYERYNLENRFTLSNDAPAYAITKSLVFCLENEINPDLINIALYPVENSNTTGFPVLFFIFRGIHKSSLIDNSGKIKESDSSWSSSNILDIIKAKQDKINEENNTQNDATSDVLGVQFDTLANDSILESLLFKQSDDFDPIIVPGGCQIGKFNDQTSGVGIEVVLDIIGSEPTTGLLKNTNHIYQTPILNLSNLSDDEKLKARFENRNSKEKILAYLDIAAFYGSCINQDISIEDNDPTNLLDNFSNKNRVYIDLRDEHGYSYNHLFEADDNVQIGFLSGNSENPINYSSHNYYADWPILILDNQQFPSSEEEFYLKLPVLSENGNPVILTCYNKGLRIEGENAFNHFFSLGKQSVDGKKTITNKVPIKFLNWTQNGSKLGSDHYLLKIDQSQKSANLTGERILDRYFNLAMKSVFNSNNIIEGEYRVKTYSSLNAPLQVNQKSTELYKTCMGIAIDKQMVTFFTFKEEVTYHGLEGQKVLNRPPLRTGVYNPGFDSSDFDYQDTSQKVGFLVQLTKNSLFKQYEASRKKFTLSEPTLTNKEFFHYHRISEENLNSDELSEFHSISFTHDEYNSILNQVANSGPGAGNEFVTNHDAFLGGRLSVFTPQELLSYKEIDVDISFPALVNVNSENSFSYRNLGTVISVSGDPLRVKAIEKN